MWQLSLPATEEFLWNCSHRSPMRLKLLKKYIFHPEQYSKSRKISVHKELTYKGERWNIYTPQVYTQFHHCRAWYFTQPYNFVTLWYSLVGNSFLCGYLSPVSLENSFSDSSNSYLNCLWRLPRNDRVTQTRFMFNQEPNSPQCHIVLAGCGLLGAVEMVPLERFDLKPWNLDMHYKTWVSEALGCQPVILVTSEHPQINDGLIQKSLCLWAENN